MDRPSFPSIEKFAAFLDGNLPQDEIQQFSRLAEQDEMIHKIIDASSIINDTIAGFTESDMQLPPEIAGSSFEIPSIPSIGISPLVTLTPSPTDDLMVVAACADEDFHCFSDNTSLDNHDNTPELTTHTNFTSDNDSFNGTDDFAGTSPDVM